MVSPGGDNKPEVELRASGGPGAPGQRWKRYGRDPKGATIIADDAVAGRAGSKRQTAVDALPAWRDSPPKNTYPQAPSKIRIDAPG